MSEESKPSPSKKRQRTFNVDDSPPPAFSSVNTDSTDTNGARRPRSNWTQEEDEALFKAVSEVMQGKWKEVCSKSPLLESRGTGMVAQRFKTKLRYFTGGVAGGKK
ncbi:25805_t:CDS:2 [Dentiscutata erythropus]|uniref:25805_t:CDS:1 n=1 Tax=Dentiscutata erythropus TaxID=1348616 RepID=A0A9N9DIK7_9GLOM|nr:25805_t:CDS:2 [Dentiscutata erythropus]